MENPRRRKRIVALLLSFIMPGLGQMYNGQLKRGIILYLGLFSLSTILLYRFCFKFYGMVLGLAILLAFGLFVWVDAFIGAIKLKEITPKPYNKWYLYLIITLIGTFAIDPLFSTSIKNNAVRSFKIPSTSMEPTMLLGDYFVADMRIYKTEKPKRGDIIVFEYPKDSSKDFIKRVIGEEGEKVEMVDKKIYISDKMIEDPWGHYGIKPPWGGYSEERFGPVVVPKDSLFVLGDNRNNSQDSRFWGFVNIKKVKGRVLYLYWAKNKSRIGMEIR